MNPILPGFYPDPSICRVGERYYLACSTFEYLPGVPIHTSTDLLTWEPLGHVLERFEQLDLRGAPSGAGIFAPSLRHHDGVFYLITTDIGTVEQGQILCTAVDPAGPWSAPVRVPGALGIDPDLFWDTDGTCHVSWTGGAATGERGILSAPLDPETGQFVRPVRRLWQGTGMAHPEGPHLYRVGDTYYCMLAEGGTERGHCESIARSSSLDGPWEPCPANPILTHRSSTDPVQSTGHADLIECTDGSWAMVHLATRPGGRNPGFHVNGRETFLVGIDWVDGWPVVDESRFDVPAADTGFRDEFDGPLDQRWISPGGVHLDLVRPLPGGGVVVSPLADERPLPVLAVRARDAAWRATVTLGPPGAAPDSSGPDETGLEGGSALQVHLDSEHWVEVRVAGGRAVAEVAAAGLRHVLADREVGPVDALWCATLLDPPTPYPSGGPDTVVLGVSAGGQDLEVGRVDGRLISTEVAGGFTGRVIGVRATTGAVTFSRFAYEPQPADASSTV